MTNEERENKAAQEYSAEISARRKRAVYSALFLTLTAIVIYSWSIYSRV